MKKLLLAVILMSTCAAAYASEAMDRTMIGITHGTRNLAITMADIQRPADDCYGNCIKQAQKSLNQALDSWNYATEMSAKLTPKEKEEITYGSASEFIQIAVNLAESMKLYLGSTLQKQSDAKKVMADNTESLKQMKADIEAIDKVISSFMMSGEIQ